MISIRPAHPEDAEAIGRLFAASRRVLTFLPELHTVEEDLAYIRDVVMTEQMVTVALRDGVIVGFVAETPGWIHHFYMDPGQMRSGIGSVLMGIPKGRNRSLELWCFRDNQAGRAFYEKHGFVAVETTDGSNNEAKAPDIRYRWERG